MTPPPVLKSSASILTWLKRRKGPSADIISDLTQLKKCIGEDELVVLGLFKVTREFILANLSFYLIILSKSYFQLQSHLSHSQVFAGVL